MSNAPSDRPETLASPPPAAPTHAGATFRTSLCHAAVLGSVGLAAALLSWAAIRQIGEVFQLPPEIARLGIGQIPGGEDQKKIAAASLVLTYKHTALWLGTTGAILGGLSGLALGLIRRSRNAILMATVGGILFGAAFSAAAGLLVIYVDQQFAAGLKDGPITISEYQMMQLHGTTWLLVGLGVGLGSSLGKPWKRVVGSTLISGIAGALGGALYPIVASIAMPLVDATLPFPKEDNRLLWLGLPCTIIGLAIGRRG